MTLVWLALAFILGIFSGTRVELAPGPVLLLAGMCGLISALVWAKPRLRLSTLLLIALLLGVARSEVSRLHVGPSDLAFYNGSTITLVGFVNAEPDVRDRGINYVVAVTELERGTRLVPVHGQVEVHTTASQILDQGDQIQVTGSLKTPVNSARIPYRDILARRGIYSEMSFPRLFVTGHVSLGLVGFALQIRQWIENSISGAIPEPEATLLIAILIGARSAQLGSLAPVLIQTGLIHLIAVSGIKIAIVAGTVNELLRRLTTRAPTLFGSLVALTAYWLVSGTTVAGLRASIMWLLVFLAAYLGRPTYALVSLGIAASGMLAFDPSLLWDTGFQLTVLATAAIVAFSPFLQKATGRLPSPIAASLTTTTAAQIGILPVQIVGFHVVSVVSLLANALVLPFIPLTMVVGFGTAIYPHAPVSTVAFGLVHILILAARWAASIPGSALKWTTISVPAVLGYYLVLVCVSVLAWRVGTSQRRRVRGEWIFGLCVASMGLGVALAAPVPRDRILFVTKGSALITSRGQNVLIDGGSRPSRLLAGLGSALPFPDDHIDAVVDTDPRAKNVASLLAVVAHYRVGKVFDPGLEYPSQTYGRWTTWLQAHHLEPVALRPAVHIQGGAFRIRVLGPDGIYSDPRDGAGALIIQDRRSRILYLGPASLKEQEDMPFRVDVRAQTVISSVPLDPTFRAATKATRFIQPVKGRSITLNP